LRISLPYTPTATCHCNFCKDEGHYGSTCPAKCKANPDPGYRMMPLTNIVKIWIDFKDVPKDDPDFYFIADGAKDDRMYYAHIVCIKICLM